MTFGKGGAKLLKKVEIIEKIILKITFLIKNCCFVSTKSKYSCIFATVLWQKRRQYLMRFKLSNETLRSLEHNTGRTYSSLTSQPMRRTVSDGHEVWKIEMLGKNKRIIPPRGSVYLQMHRVTPLKVVRNYIFRFR